MRGLREIATAIASRPKTNNIPGPPLNAIIGIIKRTDKRINANESKNRPGPRINEC